MIDIVGVCEEEEDDCEVLDEDAVVEDEFEDVVGFPASTVAGL